MKPLLRHARQLHQRRTSAFYLLPRPEPADLASPDQLRFKHMAPAADRPRTLREMFADLEFENEDETL